MDYDSAPITATFTAGSISAMVIVPVIMDDIVEESESFNLKFTISPSVNIQVIPGNITEATGLITDDTSKIVC